MNEAFSSDRSSVRVGEKSAVKNEREWRCGRDDCRIVGAHHHVPDLPDGSRSPACDICSRCHPDRPCDPECHICWPQPLGRPAK